MSKSLTNDQVYLLLLNEADLAASLDAGNFDLRQIVGFRLQPHIFLEVMFRDVISTHVIGLHFAVLYKGGRLSFNETPESMGMICRCRKGAMEQHKNNPRTESWKKGSRAIDSSGEN